MRNQSIFDSNIPFLKLHLLFSSLNYAAKTWSCVGWFGFFVHLGFLSVGEGNDCTDREEGSKGCCFSVGLIEISTIFSGTAQCFLQTSISIHSIKC